MATRKSKQGMPKAFIAKTRWNCRVCWDEFDSVALRNQHEIDKHEEKN